MHSGISSTNRRFANTGNHVSSMASVISKDTQTYVICEGRHIGILLCQNFKRSKRLFLLVIDQSLEWLEQDPFMRHFIPESPRGGLREHRGGEPCGLAKS